MRSCYRPADKLFIVSSAYLRKPYDSLTPVEEFTLGLRRQQQESRSQCSFRGPAFWDQQCGKMNFTNFVRATRFVNNLRRRIDVVGLVRYLSQAISWIVSRYYGVWTLSLKMHCTGGGLKCGGKWGRNRRILTRNESDLDFWAPNDCAKFRQNRINIATVRAQTDRPTRRTDASDLECASSYAIAIMRRIKFLKT